MVTLFPWSSLTLSLVLFRERKRKDTGNKVRQFHAWTYTYLLFLTSFSLSSGVLGGVYWGLGVGTGVFLSGVLINWLGVAKTYFVYSLVTLVILVPFLLVNFWIRLREERGNNDQERKPLLLKKTEENH